MAIQKPTFHALTVTANGGRLRDLQTACHICAAFDPTTTPLQQRPPFQGFVGIWDTGATGSVITQKVVNACGLKPFSMQKVQGAYGGVADREAFLVNIGLPNGIAIPNVTVVLGEPAGVDVLIGMDIITLGDFALTNQNGRTVFSFRIPSLHTIDYVKQAGQQQVAAPPHGGSKSEHRKKRPKQFGKNKKRR